MVKRIVDNQGVEKSYIGGTKAQRFTKTLDPATSTQHPAPSTQHPAPSTQPYPYLIPVNLSDTSQSCRAISLSCESGVDVTFPGLPVHSDFPWGPK